MAIETYTQQLERVQATIAAIEERGQAYEIDTGVAGGRKLTRADLATLYAREERLRPLAASEADGRSGRRRVRTAAPGG